MKEVKVFEKYGRTFLWGLTKDEDLAERVELQHAKVRRLEKRKITGNKENEAECLSKLAIKEEISVMEILKEAGKKRYGNQQISLKNSYLWGQDEYCTSLADLLKVLNTYKL